MSAIPLAFVLAILAVLCLALAVSADPLAATVEKSVAPSAVLPGAVVTYTATLNNTGPGAVDVLVISDTLPSGVTYEGVVAGSDVSFDPPIGTLVWTFSTPRSVPAGGSLRLVYRAHVGAGLAPGRYDNAVTYRLGSGAAVSDTATLTVLGTVLDGKKTASAGSVMIGNPLDYTITITNSGTLTGSLTSVVDTLPSGFVYSSMLIGPQPAVAGNKLTWSTLQVGPEQTIQLRYRVTAGGSAGTSPKNAVVVNGASGALFSLQSTVSLVKRAFFAFVPLAQRTDPEPPPAPPYRLAFERQLSGNMEIYAVNTDGTGLVNISIQEGGDVSAQWSPDGTRIAWVHFFSGVGDILVADPDGSDKVNLSNSAKEDRGPVWSPNGTKIAFYSRREEDRWEVYTMSPTGTGVDRLTDETCQSHSPVWSPNGGKIAFICGLDSYAEVYVMNADGTGVSRLTVDKATANEEDCDTDTGDYCEDANLDWSPDSTRLVYVKYYKSDHTKGDIFVVDVTTKAVTQLTDTDLVNTGPQWSPDGTKIAFSTYLDGSYEIATIKPDATNLVNLTRAAKYDKQARWSPDGTKIAFFTNRDATDPAIFYLYVMDADGSNQKRVTASTVNEQNADWRPLVSD